MEQITPGMYKTRQGGTAKVYDVFQERAIGAIFHGERSFVQVLSIPAIWDMSGNFHSDKESVCDLIERIGDLPGQQTITRIDPSPDAPLDVFEKGETAKKRAELRERLLVAAMTGPAAAYNRGDLAEDVARYLVNMVDAAVYAMDTHSLGVEK